MPAREIALQELSRLSQTDSDVLNDILIQHSERSLEELRSWLDNADAMSDILRAQEPAPNNYPAITQEMLNMWYTVIQLNRQHIRTELAFRTPPPQMQVLEPMQQLLEEQRALEEIRQQLESQLSQQLSEELHAELEPEDEEEQVLRALQGTRELLLVLNSREQERVREEIQLQQNLIRQGQQQLEQRLAATRKIPRHQRRGRGI